MISTIKTIFLFIGIYFVLSIPINDRTIFEHSYSYTAPYTNQIFAVVHSFGKDVTQKTSSFSRKIFSNSTPPRPIKIQDSVRSQQAAPVRNVDENSEEKEEPIGEYTSEEIESLKQILNNDL